ncbi:DUF4442 domain-containing protein [Dietzia sp.]|uniref:DUF4442 domain-containing protein n=1 Tax=Dietzia sp. TaxID=1871616 RepID=UPI002FDACEEE
MAQQVSTFKKLMSSPKAMAVGMNLWPPYLAAGVRVEEISSDYTYARVRLAKHPWNTNYVGTAFGGSLFSMSDPFWMFLTMQQLGSEYVVWDVAGEIAFKKPGTGTVRGEFRVSPEDIAEIREQAADGSKVLRWFETDLVSEDGETIATVRKQVYVRLKRR